MKVYKVSDLGRLRAKSGHVRRAPAPDRTVDGHTFASKAECVWYAKLKLLMQAKVVRWFALQPVFLLAGVKYTPDFVVYWADGHVSVEEVKSTRARFRPDWRRLMRNLKQVETIYGLKVEVVEVE